MADEQVRETKPTSNYSMLFEQFKREATYNSETILADLPEFGERTKEIRAKVLRTFQGILAPLAVCANALDSIDKLDEFRRLMNGVLQQIVVKADEDERHGLRMEQVD